MKRILFFLILAFLSLSVFGQNCSILAKANNITPDKLCSPVSAVWNVSYAGVNDAGTEVDIQYDWGDGTPIQTIPATNIGLGIFETTITHVYTSAGNVCNYYPQATLMVNGVLCTSSTQEQIVTVWDNDDHNGGYMHINPTVYPICVGNGANVKFQDLTQFNCVPPQENDVPNESTRWVQWIYGTDITMTGIPITVNGVLHTFPFSGPIITLLGPVTGSGVYSDIINVANDKLVGQYFQVTLRNWNYCNPYDDPNIPGSPVDSINGDHPPVVTTAIILIVPYPDPTITPIDTQCLQNPAITLTAHDVGGTWSGAGVSGNKFYPSIAGVGNHVITYNITDGNGCSASDQITVTIEPMPNATITPIGNMCVTDIKITLVAHDTGGVWTGNGVMGNIFDPALAGVGNSTITYNITNQYGCTNSDQITVIVSSTPNATIIPINNFCMLDTIITLVAHDAGGMWSGDGVVANIFNAELAGIGAHDITYKIVNGNCSDSDTKFITIFPSPNATINPIGVLCTESPVVILSAHDDMGGTWTGDGVIGNVFNPLIAGVGNHIITYNITNSSGCNSFDQIIIVVQATPNATITPINNLCMNNIKIPLIVHDTGGVWRGDGVIGNNFNPLIAGVGTHIIKYKIVNANCSDSDQISVTVFPIPNATITPVNSLCTDDPKVTLTAVDIGGTWTGDGITGNIFDPAIAGVGNHIIRYNVTNSSGCQDSDHIVIKVLASPNATIVPVDTLCVNHPPVTLTVVDNSGIWSGAATNNIFDPSKIGVGNHIVKYRVTNANGCSDSDQIVVTIMPIPIVKIGHVGTVFIGDPPFVLNAIPTGGTFSGIAVTGNMFDPNAAGLGVHVVGYQSAIDKFGCSASDTIHIKVIMPLLPTANFQPDTTGCAPLTVKFRNYSNNGTTCLWDFGDGVLSTETNPTHTYYTVGNYIVKLIETNITGESIFNGSVIVYQNPIAIFTIYPPEITNNSQIVVFTNYSQYNTTNLWDFGDEIISIEESPWHKYLAEGTYTVTLIISSSEGCIDSTKLTTPIKVRFIVGKIVFPNAFRWNQSGQTGGYWTEEGVVDDYIFRPHFENVLEYHLQIFNRWGVLIYESHNLYKGWDGYFANGSLAIQGVYIWKATGRFTDGRYFDIVGDVTFLH